MPPLHAPDPWAELREIETWRARAESVRANADTVAGRLGAAGAANVADLAGRYWWAHPGTVLALALGGHGADSPLTRQLAELEAKARTGSALGWRDPGASLAPRQRRLLRHEFEREQASPQWQPQSGNPDATAAWSEARRAGLIEQGVLTRPYGDNAQERYPLYESVLMRLVSAGERVPVLMQHGDTWSASWATLREGWQPPSQAEELRSTDIELRRRRGQAIDYAPINPPAPGEVPASSGGSSFAGAASGLVSRLPGGGEAQRAQRRYEVDEFRGTQSAAVDAVRQAAQGAFAGMNAPVQELQGQVRNIYGATHGRDVNWFEPQSDVGVALTFDSTDMGEGFFVDPDSEVATERRRREAERGQIGGHNVTLGRWVADATPLTTDSKPWMVLSGLVDAGVQLADPTALGFGKAAKVSEARALFTVGDDLVEAAGGLRGLARSVDGPAVDRWLTGDGAPVVAAFAREESPTRLWRMTNGKLDPEVAVRIADTTDETEVADLLRGQLGPTVRGPDVIELGRTRAPSRWRAMMPGPSFNPLDRRDAMTQLENAMATAGVSDDVATSVLDEVARARSTAGVFNAATRAAGAADGVLARAGVADPVARSKLTRLWANTHNDARRYFVDEIGQNVSWSTIVAGGDPVDAGSPHLWAELLSNQVPLFDARAIRTLDSPWQKLLAGDDTVHRALRVPLSRHDATGQPKGVSALLHGLQDTVWKRLALMRPAWPIRVVGEEQLRMAAAGYDSMFRHPLSFLSWRIGRKGGTDLLGDPFAEADEFTAAMAKPREWMSDQTRVITGEYTTYGKNAHELDDYLDGWAGELAILNKDPVAAKVAGSGTIDEAADWFINGGGNGFRRDLAEMQPALLNDAEARAYIESVSDRIRIKTGGSQELVDAIATGRLGEVPMFNGMAPHRDFRAALLERLDVGPAKVKGHITAAARPSNLSRVGQGWDRATDWLFGKLMTERTNNLSRSPMFKQEYWHEAGRLLQFATPEVRDQIIAQADEAGAKLSSRALRRKPRGDLDLETVDTLAKAHALDRTKELLYDLSRRGNVMDAMRLVWPFGEAWIEVVKTWGNQLNPATARGLRNIRRGTQVMQGAQGEDFGEVTGAPEGEGFFWENEFGEYVFTYPFSAVATKAILGVPVPLTGRVEGLSMLGTIMPGLGPVAQIPASWFMANKPDWAKGPLGVEVPFLGGTVEDQILPFGGPLDEGDPGKVTQLTTYLPPWMVRVAAGLGWRSGDPESERLWSNSVMQMARYLYSTGDYDTSTMEGVNRLLEDAADDAEGLYLIRGLAGSTAPTAPAPDYLVETGDGDAARVYALTEEFGELLAEDPATAVERFLERWGDETFLVTQSLSRANVPGLESSPDFEAWKDDHPKLVRDAPDVYALFAPRTGEHDISVYSRQFGTGERESLTPDEWLRIANHERGSLWIDKARRDVGPNPTAADREWLRDLEDSVIASYPGYDDVRTTRASNEEQIRQLVAVANHPDIKDTPVGEALSLYVRGRADAQSYAEDQGLASFRTAKRLRGTRDWLRELGDSLAAETPEFAPIWRVFEREMADDTEEEAA